MKKNFIAAVLLSSVLLAACEKEQLIDILETTKQMDLETVQTDVITTAAESADELSQTTFVGLAENRETAVEQSIADTETSYSEMPEPFEGGFDGAAAEMYRMPVSTKINEIPPELMALRDGKEVGDWLSDAEAIMTLVKDKNALPISLSTYANVYSFILSFDIAREEGEAILTAYHQYTEEELDAIFSGDPALICKTFANEYAIVVNDKLYTPQWVYWHSEEDYKAEGISPETLAEKSSLYAALPFSDEARTAFAAKLSAYTGEDISLEKLDEE